MTAPVLVKSDAMLRAEAIDYELGWPLGLSLGRLIRIWARAQEGKGRSIVRRQHLLEWGCIEPQYADDFIALCCAAGEDDDFIHFLEPRGEGRYFIVGNPGQLEKLAKYRERASAGGKAKAAKEAERRKELTDLKRSNPASSTASSTTSSEPEAPLEACLFPLLIQSPFQTPSPEEEDSEQRARAYDPPPAGDAPDWGEGLAESSTEPSDFDWMAAKWLQKAILMRNPLAVGATRANLANWAQDFRLLRTRDERSEGDITAVLRWTFEADPDHFWSKQIQSAEKFRAKWDYLSARMMDPQEDHGRAGF